MSDVAGSRRSLEGSYGEKTKRAFHGPARRGAAGGRGSDERQGVINVAMYISTPLPHPVGRPAKITIAIVEKAREGKTSLSMAEK